MDKSTASHKPHASRPIGAPPPVLADEAVFDLHPAIPRVLCPSCGSTMRLSRIDPWPNDSRRAETTTFECECGFDYRQTVRRRGP